LPASGISTLTKAFFLPPFIQPEERIHSLRVKRDTCTGPSELFSETLSSTEVRQRRINATRTDTVDREVFKSTSGFTNDEGILAPGAED
jgi:hypothetical protein